MLKLMGKEINAILRAQTVLIWTYGLNLINTGQSLYNAMFGSIGMDHVISESCYSGTLLHKNYWEMTMTLSFSYNFIVKFHWESQL